MRLTSCGIVAALTALLALAAPLAQADSGKHDSNTLHKLGKAIQYPVNKASQNASVNVHRAEGRKSVMHRRNGNKTYRTVVTPSGSLYRKHRVGYSHHTRHHTRRHRH